MSNFDQPTSKFFEFNSDGVLELELIITNSSFTNMNLASIVDSEKTYSV